MHTEKEIQRALRLALMDRQMRWLLGEAFQPRREPKAIYQARLTEIRARAQQLSRDRERDFPGHRAFIRCQP